MSLLTFLLARLLINLACIASLLTPSRCNKNLLTKSFSEDLGKV